VNEAMRRARASAFTLIELLVVVAIIALLISILLPSLQQARKQARAVACAANLHNIGIALTEYVHENGYYPGSQTDRGLIVWAPRTRRYLADDHRMFWCPEAPDEFRWQPLFLRHDTPSSLKGLGYLPKERPINWLTGFSYGYNDWGTIEFSHPHLGLGASVDSGDPEFRELREDRVKVPAEMIAVGDSKADSIWDSVMDPNPWEDEEWPSRRHFGGAEILFCDGHANWYKQETLIEFTPWAHRRWNNDNQPHLR
jgi:prepilin-type N-terminal cleavage/methylation domain-containing protein/prepilin-type processing-associated H-X9-DG protein